MRDRAGERCVDESSAESLPSAGGGNSHRYEHVMGGARRQAPRRQICVVEKREPSQTEQREQPQKPKSGYHPLNGASHSAFVRADDDRGSDDR